MVTRTQELLRQEMLRGRQPAQDPLMAALSDRIAAETLRDRAQRAARAHFARSEAARQEAEQVRESELRRMHVRRGRERDAAVAAAEHSAEKARWRAADCLLKQHLGYVQSLRRRPAPEAGPAAALNGRGASQARAAMAGASC